MILTRNNAYTGGTLIDQGWITIETPLALGGRLPGVGDTAQPATVVAAGGRGIHLKPLVGNLSLVENLVLAGNGITHPYGFISQKGALMNLNGDNVLGSAFINGATSGSGIQLNGIAGIGVEALGPLAGGEPDHNGSHRHDHPCGTSGGGIIKFGSLRLNLQGPGTYSGPVDVREGVVRVQNDTALGQAGSGTATGDEVFSTTTTTVEAGAGLELAAASAANNGGIGAGLEIANEQLVLNGAGAQVAVTGPAAGATFRLYYNGTPTVALPVGIPASGGNNPGDSVQNAINAVLPIGSSATVTQNGDLYTLVFHGTLAQVDPTTFLSATAAGGAVITVSGQLTPLKDLSSDNAKIALAGPPTGGTFILSYTNNRDQYGLLRRPRRCPLERHSPPCKSCPYHASGDRRSRRHRDRDTNRRRQHQRARDASRQRLHHRLRRQPARGFAGLFFLRGRRRSRHRFVQST